jgi:ABC-2 type transport system permease protein
LKRYCKYFWRPEAIAPGYLQKQWKMNGRIISITKWIKKMIVYAYNSAMKSNVISGKNVNIEMYYYKGHGTQ